MPLLVQMPKPRAGAVTTERQASSDLIDPRYHEYASKGVLAIAVVGVIGAVLKKVWRSGLFIGRLAWKRRKTYTYVFPFSFNYALQINRFIRGDQMKAESRREMQEILPTQLVTDISSPVHWNGLLKHTENCGKLFVAFFMAVSTRALGVLVLLEVLCTNMDDFDVTRS